jgi:hypothetical protein
MSSTLAPTKIVATREGRRTWISGPTKRFREEIRNAGAHWDPDRMAWWIESNEEARMLADRLNAALVAEYNGFQSNTYIYRDTCGGITIKTPYSIDILNIIKSIPDGIFYPSDKTWRFPKASAAAICEARPKIEEIIKRITEQNREAEIAVEMAIRQERQEKSKRLQNRFPCSRGQAVPELGKTIRYNGAPVTVEQHGSLFQGGEVTCVYYRPATPEETDRLVAEEEC